MAQSAPTVIRTLEYGRVDLPGRWNTADTRERLEAAGRKAGFRAFEIRGRQLHARGVVGVIDLGGLIVEILPKTHDDCSPADAGIFLSELLHFGGLLDRLSVVDAHTAAGERNLLEIVLSWAAREAAANIREGLPRRYQVREETSTAVRGRIEMRHLARRPPGKDFELVVRHAPLSENNPLSGTLKWLVQMLATRTRQISTRRNCERLLQELDHVADVTPNLADLDRIVLQSTEARWRPLLALARLLLRQVSPDPGRAGAHEAVAVLFTLHDLFQRVLGRVFRAGLGSHALALHSPARQLLHALPPRTGKQLSLLPDFLFGSRLQAHALVGDAKWKRILSPSGAVALSQADAYQLTTYIAVFGVPAGFVFCPLSIQPPDLLITSDFAISGLDATLHITGMHLPTLIAEGPAGIATRAALCAHVAALAPAAAVEPAA